MKKLFLLGGFLFVLAGCGQKTQPTTEKPVEEVKKEVTAKKEVVKEEVKPETEKVAGNSSNVSEEPLFYLKSDKFEVTKEIKPFDYSVVQLLSMAKGCDTKDRDNAYFEKLVDRFKGSSKIVYNFKYKGKSQDAGTFYVTIIPNVMNYNSLGDFKKDFNVCEAGSSYYPTSLNKDWLMFVSSCSSGFDNGSDLPNGCDEIKNIIFDSLKLN